MKNIKSRFGELKIIVANSHPQLGTEIAKILGIKPLEIESKTFQNNQPRVWRKGDVSGADICIVSSLHDWQNTMGEFLQLVDSVQGAARIFAVFPFVGTGKGDHQKIFGEPVPYAITAHQISSSGIDLAVIFDQHTSEHPYFYDKRHYRLLNYPHHIYLMRILIEYARDFLNFDGVLALDDGSYKRNTKIAEFLQTTDVSFVVKTRDPHTLRVDIEKSFIVGNVKGEHVISFDDLAQSGDTLITGAQIAKNNGAKSVTTLVVHNDFGLNTFDNLNPALQSGLIDKMIVLETIPLIRAGEWHPNLIVLSPAKFIAKVIACVHSEGHMRQFFLPLA